MRILVINGSPKGENSITLQTMLYLQKRFKDETFEILHAGQQIHALEKDFSKATEMLERADLVIFSYPVYTFLVPSQLHRFIELMKENKVKVNGKYFTQFSTSKHFYDTTAHQFIQDNCDDLGCRYVRGLSADMDDLLEPKGRKEAEDFFEYVRWNMSKGYYEPRKYTKTSRQVIESMKLDVSFVFKDIKFGKRVVIVTDLPEGESRLSNMIEAFSSVMGMKCDIFDLRKFHFKGGCLGCFNCAADGKCIYNDRFDEYLRNNIQRSSAIVYAFTVKDHSMGSRFKMFDDRQFCNGHRTVTMGKPVAYIVDGDLSREENLRVLMEARAKVGGNHLAGIANSFKDVEQVADRLAYCIENSYEQPKNFYGVGGLKIFRDLIYMMQGLMREDHRFYKKNGFYDFPQKRKGRIMAMYLVGSMMNNKKLKRKMGGKMTEGMLMPYRKVLEKAEQI